MFIAQFLRELLSEEKISSLRISCFTATAKDDVIADIKRYFREELGRDFEVFRGEIGRGNLDYKVVNIKDEEERFDQLVDILQDEVRSLSAIIFVRKTKTAERLSERLSERGFRVGFYHGQRDTDEKNTVQEAFMNGSIPIIVATNAFGMGVDKDNVRFVIHYDISSSIENYIQEAGRAGRDGNQSTCIILYRPPHDLDENFRLIKSSEITKKEITTLLDVIKRERSRSFFMGAQELSLLANWDQGEGIKIIETKIKTALFLLEKTGFIHRGFNRTRVFVTSKEIKSLDIGYRIIDASPFGDVDKSICKDILREIFVSTHLTIEEVAFLMLKEEKYKKETF